MPRSPKRRHETACVAHQPCQVRLLSRRQWGYVKKQFGLTARELDVAELICQGLSNAAVADRLSVAPATVKTHLRNIYRKVNSDNKIAMLLAFIAEAGASNEKYLQAFYDLV